MISDFFEDIDSSQLQDGVHTKMIDDRSDRVKRLLIYRLLHRTLGQSQKFLGADQLWEEEPPEPCPQNRT